MATWADKPHSHVSKTVFLSLAWPTVSAALIPSIVAPRLRATGLPCIASPEIKSSGNTQQHGTETTALLMLAGT